MDTLYLLFGIALATLADIGTGTLTSHILIKVFWREQEIIYYIVGIFSAILPDFDFCVAKLAHPAKEAGTEHMNYGHYPLMIVPLTITLGLFAGFFWALLVCIPLLLHFIHDSVGGQVGRRWLWPFSKKNYQLFAQTQSGFKFARAYDRSQWNEIQSLDTKRWIRACYLTPNKKLFIEVGWFSLATIFSLVW